MRGPWPLGLSFETPDGAPVRLQFDLATGREGLTLASHNGQGRQSQRRPDCQLLIPFREPDGLVDTERAGRTQRQHVTGKTTRLAARLVKYRVEPAQCRELVRGSQHRQALRDRLSKPVALIRSRTRHTLEKQCSPLGRNRRNRPVLIQRGPGQDLPFPIRYRREQRHDASASGQYDSAERSSRRRGSAPNDRPGAVPKRAHHAPRSVHTATNRQSADKTSHPSRVFRFAPAKPSSHTMIRVNRFRHESGTPGSFTVGFESTEIARWRLSSLVSTDDTLGHMICDALSGSVDIADMARSGPETPITALDELGRDALDTPGIGANFLTAFAAQNRAVHLIWEMHQRGAHPLPADVAAALQQAIRAANAVWC